MKKIIRIIFYKYIYYKLSKKANIGKNVLLNRTSQILLSEKSTSNDVIISDNVMMYGKLYSENHGKITIGEYSSIRKNSAIWCVKKISIGKYVIISDNVLIMDNNSHPVDPMERLDMIKTGWSTSSWKWKNSISDPVIIEDNVWIGKDVKILKGVQVGKNSILAIGSVVVKDVPANVVVAGNPAKIVKNLK